MVKLAWKGVRAHKIRLGLTAIAIVLGVAFVSGTFVFTDTLNRAFTGLFDDIFADIDVYVRGETDFDTEIVPVPASVLEDVRNVEGIGLAVGSVEGFAQIIDKDGDPISAGAPTFGFSWNPEGESLSPITVREGRAPAGPGEVMIDIGTAETNDLAVGDVVRVVILAGSEEFEIVGLSGFGTSDNVLGASLASFDEATAIRLFNSEGEFASISASLDGSAALPTVLDRVNDILPSGILAVSGTDQSAQDSDDLEEAIGFLSTALLVFAGVGVLVGSFIIYNTFTIIIAQRTKEMAMLRAVGATSAQVTRMIVVEALVVGVIASAIGIAAGVGITLLLRVAFDAFGIGFPQGPLTLRPRTVVVGMLVGMAVTLFSALVPARQAARIPPVAAISEATTGGPRSLTKRLVAGSILTAIGLVILSLGLFGSTGDALTLTGVGAVVVFLGVTVLAPLVARRSARFIGSPLPKMFGVTGTLARENSVRRPRRTAATASALMIGVAVVSVVAILASSLKQSIEDQVTTSFGITDFQIESTTFGDPAEVGLVPAIADELKTVPELGVVSVMKFGIWKNEDDSDRQLVAVDPDTLEDVFVADIQVGSVAALADGGVLLQVDAAADLDASVGSTVPMRFPLSDLEQVPVVGIFAGEGLFTSYLVSNDFYAERYANQLDYQLFVNVADGVDNETGRAAIEAVLVDYPNAEAKNQAEFIEDQKSQIDVLLVVVNALLALAIIIALLGIANTLALSIFERKRELGLLRAVGMTRRQVRRMIRWEAVITALFGAFLGLLVGIVLGWAVVFALEDEGLTFGFPFQLLTTYVIVAGLGGVIASLWPSFRGAKTNVLEAIAYE